ncbi:MAG TPA: histidine kinase, partial [Candidatus Dormibacteraeota bacterium]|nr:histidine kinase [Candidatus Dormibacteraeota bacterium]
RTQSPQAGNTGARTVTLAARLARHTAAGWDNAAIPDDVAEVASFLNLSPGAAMDLVTQVDVD